MTGMVRPLKWPLLSSPINSCLYGLFFIAGVGVERGHFLLVQGRGAAALALTPPSWSPSCRGSSTCSLEHHPLALRLVPREVWPSARAPGVASDKRWDSKKPCEQNGVFMGMIRVCVYTQGSGNKWPSVGFSALQLFTDLLQ